MTAKDLTYIALFAALTAALGLFPPITLPAIGVPITAQTLGVMLAGAIAGPKRGGLAMVLFCVLVAIGLPLLSGGRGGFGMFLSPSGGFLLSWPIAAFVIGTLFAAHRMKPSFPMALMYLALGGILVVYLIGIPWLAMVGKPTLMQAFIGSMPFVVGDAAKVIVAAFVAQAVRRAYPMVDD